MRLFLIFFVAIVAGCATTSTDNKTNPSSASSSIVKERVIKRSQVIDDILYQVLLDRSKFDDIAKNNGEKLRLAEHEIKHLDCSNVKYRTTEAIIKEAMKAGVKGIEQYESCIDSKSEKWLSDHYRGVVAIIESYNKPELAPLYKEAFKQMIEGIKYQSIQGYRKPRASTYLPNSLQFYSFNLCGFNYDDLQDDKEGITKKILSREITSSGVSIEECSKAGVASHKIDPAIYIKTAMRLYSIGSKVNPRHAPKPDHYGNYTSNSRSGLIYYSHRRIFDQEKSQAHFDALFTRTRDCELTKETKIDEKYYVSSNTNQSKSASEGYSHNGAGGRSSSTSSTFGSSQSVDTSAAARMRANRNNLFFNGGCRSNLLALTDYQPLAYEDYIEQQKRLDKFTKSKSKERDCIKSYMDIYNLNLEEAALACYRNDINSDLRKQNFAGEKELTSQQATRNGYIFDAIYLIGISVITRG